jgi:hypothetical protein
LVVHDVNEERLETALIPDFWLYTCGDKLYCAYPTLKDIKSRNWEKPVKDRQYPCPNWTSWPAVHRRDFGISLFVLTMHLIFSDQLSIVVLQMITLLEGNT